MRAKCAAHPIEDTGRKLRAMMPWIAERRLVDKTKNRHSLSTSSRNWQIRGKSKTLTIPDKAFAFPGLITRMSR